jgi:ubiquinone/menaquinone biosynthesis C-methylase UbiE
LHRAGIPVVGIDLSIEMLRVLIDKAGEQPFPVALADATRLPFGDATFGAALAAHVLHLVSDLAGTLEELVRVVRPGGVILLELGGPAGRAGMAWWAEARDVFARAAGITPPRKTHQLRDEAERALGALGARPRVLPGVEERRTWIPEERIARLEQGMYSFTWDADEVARLRGGAALRAWAAERLGSLDRPVEARRTITWIAYDL